jgi:hypothetical protein
MRVGVTGHQQITHDDGWAYVEDELRVLLSSVNPPLSGISSIAAGADQLFARLVVDLGGSLYVVLPFADYERTLHGSRARTTFRRLVRLADEVETLEWSKSDEESFFSAGKRVVDLSELLVAVWDGRPAQGLGGTADVVAYAKERGRPTHVVDVARWR